MSEKINHSNNPNPIWSDFSTSKEAHTADDELAAYTQELSQKDVISQIKTISELAQKAENAEIPFGEILVREFFEKIQQNKTYPPIIKCLVKSLCPDPNSGEIVETPVFHSDPDNSRSYLPFQELAYDSPYINMTNEEEILQKQEELLLKLESEYAAKIQVDEDGDKLYPDEMYYSQASIMTEANWAIENLKFQKGQQKLHDEYPTLPENSNLVRIASDATGTISFNQLLSENEWMLDEPVQNFTTSIDLVSDKNGNLVDLNNPKEPNHFNLTKDTAFLLQTIHNQAETRQIVESELNISLSDIPLESQISLLGFMTKANNDRFDNLCQTLQRIDNEDLRIKLLENFVATDFGEDFGDSLLDIVNSDKISPEQTKAILESIISCRKSIDGITSLYNNFDQGSFSKQYKKASNERLTDIITVFREIGKNGSASADLDWAGSPIFDYDSAMEALEYEKKSLEIINGTMNDVLKRKEGSFAEIVISPQKDKMKRTLYSFYSEKYGYSLLYTRPEGGSVFDPSFEYGNKNGVEASISFITNPKAPFSLPNPFRPNLGKMSHKSTLDKVSAIRLDREGRTKNMAPNDPNRNPINKTGIVSVDLAAIGDSEETPSGKIARLISIGNKLRAKNEKTSLNHNIAHFDQDKYGPEEGFKKIVDYIDKIATQLCKENPPKNTQESFTRLKKQQHGRKVLKHTT